MASIVKYHDKRSGLVYAYENKSIWDEKTQKRKQVRTLLGKVDPGTGEIIPTDGRGKKRGYRRSIDMEGLATAQFKFYGLNKVLEELADRSGLRKVLESSVSRKADLALSCIFYLTVNVGNGLEGIEIWSRTHVHPYLGPIGSKERQELDKSFTKAKCQKIIDELSKGDTIAAKSLVEDIGISFVKNLARAFKLYILDELTAMPEPLTLQDIINELEIIGAIYNGAEEFQVGIITERQAHIYELFGLEAPVNIVNTEE